MPQKRYRPEEIIAKLRQADVLLGEGKKVPEVVKALGIHEVTYYRWRKEYGGLQVSQAKRLKDLERENARLRRAVSDLTLDKLILQEASRGNFCAPRGGADASPRSVRGCTSPSGGPAGRWARHARPSATGRSCATTRTP